MSDVRFQVQSSFREFLFRELSAVAGAITITCLRVCSSKLFLLSELQKCLHLHGLYQCLLFGIIFQCIGSQIWLAM
ncbi:hypothetical protein Tsubulata_047126 [Turnera subulata]|uniref:Uncharacterized protein n=1 Tax=Turnera subulata TaxID=218843 RepID=A0A9Q0JHH4_9ROSI|nr:hypothetical protein Tsubulata_047126 [Turnera subulata]